jgi:5-methylcytosine-specific restriction endonuclease McrA
MDRGITPELERIRRSAEYRAWRAAVFERDDFTCQDCGKRGGYLEADHIKTFAHHPDLRFELSNGRTLCQPCHRKTPTFGGRSRVTAFSKGF